MHKRNFTYKLSLLFILVICLPMTVLSFFTVTSMRKVMNNNSQQLNKSNLESMANNLNVYFDKYKQLTDALFISSPIQSVAKANPQTRMEKLITDREYQQEITTLTINSFDLEGTYLFAKNGNEYFSHRNYNIDSIREACRKYMSSENVSNRSYMYVSGAWLQSQSKGQSQYKVLLMRPLYDFTTREFIGVIVLEFVPTIFQTLLGYTNDITFVTDKENHILFDSTSQKILEGSPPLNLEKNSGIAGTVNYNNKQYSETRISTKYGWNIVQLIDYSQNNYLLLKPLLPIIWVAIFSVAVFVVIAITMAKRLVAPIKTLQLAMKNVEQGDMMHHVHIHTKDELEELGNSYNDMLDKLNLFIDKAYHEEIQHLDAEYRALQSQINPHFLYNALETISCLAQTSEQPQISKMVCSLADMFRYTTRQKDRFVPVTSELDYLKDYFLLQSAGYEEKVQSIFDIDPDILNRKMPKMILQPIVENCFNYALGKSGSTLIITVTGKESDHGIYFRISDNGVGISVTDLEKLHIRLNNKEQDTSPDYDSIGLSNINNRLKMACGEKSGIEICSELSKGTVVVVYIYDK